MPATVSSAPAPTLVQNTVDLSASVMVWRWISACPKARSEKTSTRLEKTRTIAARP